MISNERTWPSQRRVFNRQPYFDRTRPQRRPPPRLSAQEDALRAAKLQIERKQFSLALKENPRGRFLWISEQAGGRQNTIVIPIAGLAEFQQVLEAMTAAAGGSTPAPTAVMSDIPA